jgi:hypothetical protein
MTDRVEPDPRWREQVALGTPNFSRAVFAAPCGTAWSDNYQSGNLVAVIAGRSHGNDADKADAVFRPHRHKT